MRMASRAKIDDGQLDVVVQLKSGPWEVAHVADLYSGRVADWASVRYLQGRTIMAEPVDSARVLLDIDCEPLGRGAMATRCRLRCGSSARGPAGWARSLKIPHLGEPRRGRHCRGVGSAVRRFCLRPGTSLLADVHRVYRRQTHHGCSALQRGLPIAWSCSQRLVCRLPRYRGESLGNESTNCA